MRLSKLVPAHTHAVEFQWVKHDFMKFGFYRGVRERHRQTIDRGCFWCRIAFKDDDSMALAGRKNGGNVLLCSDCASQAAPRPVPSGESGL